MITADQLRGILPNCKDTVAWSAALNDQLPKFGITTPQQISMFIAQCGHESGEFNVMSENLNYSGDRLLVVFPKYFKGIDVTQYNRQPEKIANRVYGGRLGNGPESSGEGFKYRGSGLIQLTGKENFTKCSQALFKDDRLVTNPDMVRTDKTIALQTALWFWDTRKLSSVSDIVAATKIINGGTHGLEDRTAKYNKGLGILR